MDATDLLRGHHLVVTGASSGIGLALATRAVEAGARVTAIALDDDALARLRAAPPRGAHEVHIAGADVSDRERLRAAIAGGVAQHGPCDLLVTCAGIVRPGYFTELSDAEFEREMAVNYFGTLWAIRAVVPSMIERGRGRIACVSSFAALLGVFGYTAYAPSKYAVRGLCETLRVELKPKGIHVAGVYPTDVDTPMLAYEQPLQPREQRALNATVKPIPTTVVVDAIIDALAHRRSRVYPGRGNSVLAHVVGSAPEIATRYFDLTVARAPRGD